MRTDRNEYHLHTCRQQPAQPFPRSEWAKDRSKRIARKRRGMTLVNVVIALAAVAASAATFAGGVL